MTERLVGMTPRLERELNILYEKSSKEPTELVFGLKDNVKKSFSYVRAAAGLSDLRFHDLRHTAATRMAQSGMPLSEIGRILGHSEPTTTYRYVNANAETARRAANALAAFSEVKEGESRRAAIN